MKQSDVVATLKAHRQDIHHARAQARREGRLSDDDLFRHMGRVVQRIADDLKIALV